MGDMCDGLSCMGILRPSTSARADPRASQINKHMRIHACIMYLYVYTERFTITHTRVDVYTIGTTRTHIKSCPSRPPHTHRVTSNRVFTRAQACMAHSAIIGIVCCARMHHGGLTSLCTRSSKGRDHRIRPRPVRCKEKPCTLPRWSGVLGSS